MKYDVLEKKKKIRMKVMFIYILNEKKINATVRSCLQGSGFYKKFENKLVCFCLLIDIYFYYNSQIIFEYTYKFWFSFKRKKKFNFKMVNKHY